jgi:hypothetical protein
MLEIDKYVVDKIKNDATISGYTGKDANDSRVYTYRPSVDVIFSPKYPAAIFYRDNQNPQPKEYSYPSQVGDIYYYFQVVSDNKTLTKQIGERLVSIFKDISITTTNWRVLIVKSNGNSEGVPEGTPTKPLYVRNVSFLLREVFER